MATMHELDKDSFGQFLAQMRRERGLTQRGPSRDAIYLG